MTASNRSSQRSTSARLIASEIPSSFVRNAGSRVTSQWIGRRASGCVKPASAWSSRATAAPTARRVVGETGTDGNARPSMRATSWTAWPTPSIVTEPMGRRSIVRRGCGIGSAVSARRACSIASTCISTTSAGSAGLPTLRTNDPAVPSIRKLRSRSPSSDVASPSTPKTVRAISTASSRGTSGGRASRTSSLTAPHDNGSALTPNAAVPTPRSSPARGRRLRTAPPPSSR